MSIKWASVDSVDNSRTVNNLNLFNRKQGSFKLGQVFSGPKDQKYSEVRGPCQRALSILFQCQFKLGKNVTVSGQNYMRIELKLQIILSMTVTGDNSDISSASLLLFLSILNSYIFILGHRSWESITRSQKCFSIIR